MAILACMPWLRRRALRLGFPKNNAVMFDALPNDIIEKILSKLPTYQVLQCRAVCKRWQHVIDDPLFAEAQIKCEEEPSVTAFQCPGPAIPWSTTPKATDINDLGLQLIHPARDKKESSKRGLERMVVTPIRRRFEVNPSDLVMTYGGVGGGDERYRPVIRGSCNGLIIFGGIKPPWRYSICNPVTRESAVLAKLSSEGLVFVCGFYFHSRRKEYRLLCVTRPSVDDNALFRYYTCDLNEQSQKELGLHPYRPCRTKAGLAPVVVDGFLHSLVYRHQWPSNEELHRHQSIMTLDLDTEDLSFMPHPGNPFLGLWGPCNLVYVLEAEGRLCLYYKKLDWLRIWLLEDRASWLWVEVLSTRMRDGPSIGCIAQPLSIKDGEVLLNSEDRGLVRVEMQSGRREEIIMEAAYLYDRGQRGLTCFPMATCKLSLLSLSKLNI